MESMPVWKINLAKAQRLREMLERSMQKDRELSGQPALSKSAILVVKAA